MEGPPLKAIAEKLAAFKGKRILSVTGTARIDKEAVKGQTIEGVFNRGKNLFIGLRELSFRIHFLMFGSYRINAEEDGRKPRLSLSLEGATLSFYNCPVSIIGNLNIDKLYDEEIDITSDKWKPEKMLALAAHQKTELICDVLLSQAIFLGVGNIIKNEALFLAGVHPLSVVGKIPELKIREIVQKSREFSLLFYEIKKKGEPLEPSLQVYGKKKCKGCSGGVVRKRTGRLNRISYTCESCQVLYA